VPGVLQFYGMEFDTPAADHSSLIIPKVADERDILFSLESRFAKRDAFPTDPGRDTEPKMLEALRAMRGLRDRPVLFAIHPARSATGLGSTARAPRRSSEPGTTPPRRCRSASRAQRGTKPAPSTATAA
jgi:hypothetical protein